MIEQVNQGKEKIMKAKNQDLMDRIQKMNQH